MDPTQGPSISLDALCPFSSNTQVRLEGILLTVVQ